MKYKVYKKGEFFGDRERYLILEPIGRDHRDEIYRVRDTAQDSVMVLKILPREIADDHQLQMQFLQLLTLTHTFDHPNIIQPIAFETNTKVPFFTMKDIDGRPLLEMVSEQSEGKLSIEQVISIARQMAKALDYTHGHETLDAFGEIRLGIFHGNLKPSNVFISDKGCVQVSEFCIAEFFRSGLTKPHHRHIEYYLYLSPEQYRGQDWDHRADIFSFGVIVYQLLAGNPPFPNSGICMQDSPPKLESIPTLSPEQNSILLKMLAYNTEERYDSIYEAMIAFEEAPLKQPETTSEQERVIDTVEFDITDEDREKSDNIDLIEPEQALGSDEDDIDEIEIERVDSKTIEEEDSIGLIEPESHLEPEDFGVAGTIIELDDANDEEIASKTVKQTKPQISKQTKQIPRPVKKQATAPEKIKNQTWSKNLAIGCSILIIFLIIFWIFSKSQKTTIHTHPPSTNVEMLSETPTSSPTMNISEDETNILIKATLEGVELSGAPVYINGEEYIGETPLKLNNFTEGQNSIHIFHDNAIGFKDFDYRAGQAVEIEVPLYRDSAIVKINAVDEGADVLVDDMITGEQTPATLILPSGKHSITIQKEGFQSRTKTITCRYNVYENIRFEALKQLLKPTPIPKPTATPIPKTIGPPKTIRNSIGMTFRRIDKGRFLMGLSTDKQFRENDEASVSVVITTHYYIQITEVTQRQWRTIMDRNPSKFNNCGDDCPVENVSYYEVQRFIEKLNSQIAKDGYTYRLPTEAEWEYASRSGHKTSLPNGNLIQSGCSPIDSNLNKIAWYCGNSNSKTHPVGQKRPNAFGLYDMNGNVWEWCQDIYGDYPQTSNALRDYQGPQRGRTRVLRGGSWNSPAEECRSTNRYKRGPARDDNETGFRLVAVPVGK